MKAVVCFPGIRYSCDAPLLYFGAAAFQSRGYQVFSISYGDALPDGVDLQQATQLAGAQVLEQLRAMPLQDCEDLVFVSKSIGTVLAGWAAQQLGLQVRQFYLTPLSDTLAYIHPETDYVVGGGNDPFLEGDTLDTFCTQHQVPFTLIPDVGHRLECKENTLTSLAILQQIVELYHAFTH